MKSTIIPFVILSCAAISMAQTASEWTPIGGSSSSTYTSGTMSSGTSSSTGGWTSIGGSSGSTGGTTYSSGTTGGTTDGTTGGWTSIGGSSGTYNSGPVTTNYYSSGSTGYNSGSTYSSGMTLKYAAGHTHPDGVAVATDHWHGSAGYSHGHGGYATGGNYGWSKLVEWQLPYERGLRWDDGRAWRPGGQYTPGHPRKDLQMAELYPWEKITQTQVATYTPPPAPPAPMVEQPMCRGRGNWR